MPLTAADLTRIVKYRAFDLGSQAGGPLTYQSVLQLVQNQINFVNANDVAFGTNIAGAIQADLDQMDTDDESSTAAAANDGLKRVDVIEYYQGGASLGYSGNMERLRQRVIRNLSQTYESDRVGAGLLGRG